MTMYRSRPRIDEGHRQNNPTNWILDRFREKEPLVRSEITDRLGIGYPILYWVEQLGSGRGPSEVDATAGEITHAHCVLARLATFRDQAREKKK